MNNASLISQLKVWVLSLLTFTICSSAFAEKDLSSWRKYSQGEWVRETTAFAPGQMGTLGFKISLADKWHTYWVNPGDSGAPIRLKFNTGEGVKVRRVLFPYPLRELTGPLISFAYSHEVLLPVEIAIEPQIRPGTELKVNVEAEWLVCEDVCIPAIQSFDVVIPVGRLEEIKPSEHFKKFQAARLMVPQIVEPYPKLVKKDGAIHLQLAGLKSDESLVEFFPFKGSGVSNEFPKVRENDLEFEEGTVEQLSPNRVGVALIKNNVTGEKRALQFGDSGWSFASEVNPSLDYIVWMLLSAFLGGLILNLMPCVFPILSMKLLSLLKLGQAHAREVREQNLAYVGGVLLSFFVIAATLSVLREAGQLVGWGFQLQSPLFLTLLIWLFVALTLNLLGIYEFEIINAGFGHRLTRLGGLWGSFFTGVLAVIVASPCTAPFMGAALGFGISQPLPVLFAVFLLLGLGLAFPYLVFVIFPGWTRFLPRPGAWMNYLKQVMAIPMLATAGWLLWVLVQAREGRALYIVLAGSLMITIALWYSGKQKTILRGLTALLLVIAAGAIYVQDARSKSAGGVSIRPPWMAFTEDRLSSLKGQSVFVDMTADWCLSCKVNEKLVLEDSEVQALLKEKKVALLKGDWTQRNEEITRFLAKYDRVGVPFYILFSPRHPQGIVLPEVLTKSQFLDQIKNAIP